MSTTIAEQAKNSFKAGNFTLSWDLCKSALKIDYRERDCNEIMGMMCNKAGRYADAEKHLRLCLSHGQPSAIVLTELASTLIYLNQINEAQELLMRSAELDSNYEKTFIQQAKIFKIGGDITVAEEVLTQLIRKNPKSVSGLNNLANIAAEKNNIDEALRLLHQALEISPENGNICKTLGILYLKKGVYKQALSLLLQAHKFLPADVDVLFGIGKILDSSNQPHKAVNVYQRILTIDPGNGEAMMLAGIINWNLHNYEVASNFFSRVFEAHPHYTEAFYRLLRCKADMADWTDRELIQSKLIETVTRDLQKTQPLACSPMDLHYFNLPDELQYEVMHRFSLQNTIAARPDINFSGRSHDIIRIGYLSPDFRKHALGMSVFKMFGCHNREKFEVYVFSQYIPNPADPFHVEIKNSADTFIDLQGKDEQASAQLIYDNEIDILIDFGGYSTYTKAGILSLKPAPIIVHMFGQPDTTAMPQVDYFVSDHNLIDTVNRQFYDEKILYLPHGFICSPIVASGQPLTRAQFGINDDAFVFCSFCSPYKYEPKMFAVWMQLLKQVDNSVLWLMTNNNKSFEQNIVASAALHGVSSDKILFAMPMPIDEHLQRMTLCDLFLDTLYYSSCSTASHALMAGLPVVTLRGNTNASRQGATVCKASGVTQTICHSMDEYIHIALNLATNRQQINEIKTQLTQNRNQIPHFDIELNTRYIEAGYLAIWQRFLKGQEPEDIEINEPI